MPAIVIDWLSIKTQYEQGVSQNTLSKLHGVSQQAISKRARKEKWIATLVVVSPTTPYNALQRPSEEAEDLSIVDQALADLAYHLHGQSEQAKLQLTQHKLFADAFSQYNKIKLLMPRPEDNQQTQSGITADVLRWLELDEVAVIDALFKKAEERKEQYEVEHGIKPIRRIG